ncbi:DUF6477 family protein [Rhodovulum sp. YNF3179]|uniref:DUF6477 family protein n=1 Tax=Rhodovulum sp. YNF3179 TaxID=3425127 RepID=UPI003D33FFA4
MSDFFAALHSLRRPKLLIRAARLGLEDYVRDRDLARITRSDAPPPPGRALDRLMVEEDLLEQTRRAGDAGYSVTRHVELLIALMAEARLLPRPVDRLR